MLIKRATFVISLLLVPGVLLGAFAQTPDQPVFHAVSNGWTIDGYRTSTALGIQLIAKSASGASRRVVIDDESAVKAATVWNDAVLVAISEGQGTDTVHVLSLRDGRVLDTFWGWYATPSPDGRLIAFKEFHPMRYEGAPFVGLVYDLTKSVLENRMEPMRPEDQELRAGWAFFPDYNRTQHTYDMQLQRSGDDHHVLLSPFTWIDSTRVVFVELFQKARVVLVDLSRGVTTPAVSVRELDEDNLVDASKLDPGTPAVSMIRVKSIAATERQGHLNVTLTLLQAMGVKQHTVTVEF